MRHAGSDYFITARTHVHTAYKRVRKRMMKSRQGCRTSEVMLHSETRILVGQLEQQVAGMGRVVWPSAAGQHRVKDMLEASRKQFKIHCVSNLQLSSNSEPSRRQTVKWAWDGGVGCSL